MSPALWAMAPLIKYLGSKVRGLIEKAFVSINDGAGYAIISLTDLLSR